MTATRSIDLLAVGVDVTGVLVDLSGAASGARAVAGWLKKQARLGVAIRSKVLVDKPGKAVTAREVQRAAQRFVDERACDLLILYFAGHGIVKSGGDEQVLLSNIARFNDEAIDIAATASNARFSGIDHVVIISDACRSPTTYGGQFDQVSGKPAIKRGNLEGKKTQVDTFYATEPSKSAKEYKGVGFFTEMLLTALETCPPEIRSNDVQYAAGRAVVPAFMLANYLEDIVPVEASQRIPPFEQTPDIIVASHVPRFVAFAPDLTQRGAATHVTPMTERALTTRELPALVRTDALRDLGGVRLLGDQAGGLEQRLAQAGIVNTYRETDIDANRRRSFETRTGYIFVGAKVMDVLVHGRKPDRIPTPEGTDIRLFPELRTGSLGNKGSAIVLLEGGTVCVLPVMPGYVGTIGVEKGRVRSLAFQLSENERRLQGISEASMQELQLRRTTIASLAATGRLWRLARKDAIELADFIRQGKRMDPTLGIYSAYAYATAGKDKGTESIFRWVAENYMDRPYDLPAAPVPFDTAMLAGKLTPEVACRPPGFAPFCPMLTLGWSLLEANTFGQPLHDAIIQAGRHRLNAEWTTFERGDVAPLIAAFEKGEIL
jgi:hypothetical protein